ncbi:cupin domain-containing protein [Paenibacillus antri]|uniref:Cupin domain-containing protein n=2 Tax=Paenibacillus antri TaxID=2582848 RepID=A0A5R9GAK0_9BACL|nr:cupin domain-containing protein [Paenibacillus antri]
MTMKEMTAGTFETCAVHKISASDTNKFVLLCDGSQAGFVSVVEIFEPGGQTPPNIHKEAQEYFYVLYGEGVAIVDEARVPLKQGSFMVVPPQSTHQVLNTGASRLYTLTTMVPDEDFSDLIKAGPKAELDEEDKRVLSGAIAGS